MPAENSSLTEKPSEVSDSQVSQSSEIRITSVHIYTHLVSFFISVVNCNEWLATSVAGISVHFVENNTISSVCPSTAALR